MRTRLLLGLLLAVSVLAASWSVSGYLGPRMFSSPTSGGGSGQNHPKPPNSGQNDTMSSTTIVSLLIDFGNGTRLWFNDTRVAISDNFYNVTSKDTNGNLQATPYSALGAHLVNKIMGYPCNTGCTGWWSLWTWNSASACWSFSSVGVDLLHASSVSTVAWYFTNNDPNSFPDSCQ